MQTVPYGPLLDDVEPKFRGSVTNYYLDAVRAGVSDPEQVVLYVRAVHSTKGTRYPLKGGRQSFNAALHVDDRERSGAGSLALARWAVWWWGLHPAVRQQIKFARSLPYLRGEL